MKRLMCLLLALCLLPILAACGGGGEPPENPPEGEVFSEGLAYEKNGDDTCTITGIGTCTDTEIRVPYTIEDCRVTAIAAGAFKVQRSLTASAMATLYPGTGGIIDRLPDDFFDDGKNPAGSDAEEERVDAPKDEETNARLEAITSVELPIYLDDIGDEAFLGCEELAEISTRQLVSMIGKDCFKETAFYNDPANWENGVLYLEGYLVEVKKDFEGPLAVKEGTFSVAALAAQDCTGITSLSLPETLNSVCRRAFYGCAGIEEITFPKNLRFIGLRAFQGCSAFKSLTLGCYDLNVQGYAFRDCTSLKSIAVGLDLDYYERLSAGDILIQGGSAEGESADLKGFAPSTDASGRPYVYPTVMQHGIFKGCTSLEAVELKKTVNGMLNGWFTDCTALRSVKLSDNMKTLGSRSFADCPELSELDLGTGLTSIWSQAFYNCPKLTEFAIPDGVTTLEAFYWNCPVEKITFGAGIQKIDWTYPEISVFYYNGTMEQWAKVDISKWKNKVVVEGATLYVRGAFTVKCLDGDIYDPNGFTQ